MIRVFLPYIELCYFPLAGTLGAIKRAGYDGVECHLVGSLLNHRRVLAIRHEAEELGLGFHAHQGWSFEENSFLPQNRILDLLGCLPHPGYTLEEHVPQKLILAHDPVVVYADRFPEILGHDGYRVQTCSVFNEAGKHKLPFPEFCASVKRHGFPVVFDTQHYLEYAAGAQGVGNLTSDPRRVLKSLTEGWEYLGRYVAEIHLVDFNPTLGHARGRNVPLGTGIAPLHDFCRMVKGSGWEGTVVPEVNPLHLFHNSVRLRELRECVLKLFS